MRLNGIHLDQEALARFCRHHCVRRLSVYGSILRDDFGPSSDIDLLVEFDPHARVSLFDLGGMLMELRELLGREVDLRTPQDLSEHFRQEVLREARVLYAAA